MTSDAQRIHGGTDADGVARWDFSTNSNACGPCPVAWQAVQQADATHYPDPHYRCLRQSLANFHGVEPQRVVLAGSASEAIHRISAWVFRVGGQTVFQPSHAFGEYAHAAQQWGLRRVDRMALADLAWVCDPSSPLGHADPAWMERAATTTAVVDRAYAPLRLDTPWSPEVTGVADDAVWHLFSPNKALGMTGVRGAYLIAPRGAEDAVAQLDAMAPSWVLGVHGVALLQSWTQAATQQWLRTSLDVLRNWTQRQHDTLLAMGWQIQGSVTPYGCAQPVSNDVPLAWPIALRRKGIKLRDASSFGLPGWWRLRTLPPEGQDALAQAWQECRALKVLEDMST